MSLPIMKATVTQDIANMTQPYKVLTGCGHIAIRRMRPATAGVSFTAETILSAPNGRPCPRCERTEPATHTHAADCSIDPATFCCIVCGVDHSEACAECRNTGFHAVNCSHMLMEATR